MLTEDQINFFNTNGYVLLENLLSASELEEARKQMLKVLTDRASTPAGVGYSTEPVDSGKDWPIDPSNPDRVWMLFDTPLAGDWWSQNIRDPRITEAMSDLLGPNINFHNGKARIKPPGYGSHQGWHQDFPYERHSSPDLAAAILYLDDTAVGASATEVIPGSHLQGEWKHNEKTLIPDEAVEAFRQAPVALEVKAGSVAIIHVLVVHRAAPNKTGKNRSAIINEYKTMEAVDLWGNKCAFAELPLVREGKIV